jgi:hypothetical protein
LKWANTHQASLEQPLAQGYEVVKRSLVEVAGILESDPHPWYGIGALVARIAKPTEPCPES